MYNSLYKISYSYNLKVIHYLILAQHLSRMINPATKVIHWPQKNLQSLQIGLEKHLRTTDFL